MAPGHFRDHLPDLSLPRFTSMTRRDAHEYAAVFQETGNPPWIFSLYQEWLDLAKEPFKGITSDGTVSPAGHQLADEGIPIESIVGAATSLLEKLSDQQRDAVSFHIDAPEWRTWSNPEFLLSDKGIRLDEVSSEIRDCVLQILEVTLSPEGYAKALGAMRMNHFLGHLVQAPAVTNEHSYNFAFFGSPSTSAPWSFTFYGHHLCLNIFLYKTQIVVAPWFTGAEPNVIDDGPHEGTRILFNEDALGLQLMQSLPPSQQAQAQTYKLLRDPQMPYGRWNHDDQRHLCAKSAAPNMYQFYDDAINLIASIDPTIPIYISDGWNLNEAIPYCRQRNSVQSLTKNPVVIDTHKYFTFGEKHRSKSVQEIIQEVQSVQLSELDHATGNVCSTMDPPLSASSLANSPSHWTGARGPLELYINKTIGCTFWSYKFDWEGHKPGRRGMVHTGGGDWGFRVQVDNGTIFPPRAMAMTRGAVQTRVQMAWKERQG
ncbi:uncharacterized protein Z518_00315 [Rhinocladiella mackenziei CBS 650.93]|uniref:Uncharacterized protein n=1 Tax=Rhinocladiella mackenziei CBS 650.93 TaxID=1442369 RepID=A0A0D2J0N1_9EURO|nr:uncharacterized protein Z518_00315 [Rhinocladiella mackenziei CBS 650.93]KIX09236.1 hypothetical protein Z518_00315 [Rhinocladiella mackenziei CBS 650.93]